jgi:hypothetical protein
MIHEAEVGEGFADLELGLSPTGYFVLAKSPNHVVLPLAQYGDVLLAVGGYDVTGETTLERVVSRLRACSRPLVLVVASPSTTADCLKYYGDPNPLPLLQVAVEVANPMFAVRDEIQEPDTYCKNGANG